MGIKKVKVFENIPLIEGKTYETKNEQGLFLVNRIAEDKNGNQMTAWGNYIRSGLTNCPLSVDRLIHERKEICEHDVCDHCSTPLN